MATLRERTIKNSAYSFLAYAVPFLLTFFLTPLIIHRLGVEQYGLFVLVSVITGFFSLFKFGLGWGVVNAVGRHVGAPDADRVSKFVSSALVFMLVVGLLGCAVSFVIGFFGTSVVGIHPDQARDAARIFSLAGIAFIFSSVTSVFANILNGAQRQDIYSKIYLVGLVAMNLLMLGAVLAGFGVSMLVAIQLALAVATCAAFYAASRRLLPELAIRLSFSKVHFMQEIGFNAYAYIHESATALLFEFDKVLIASFVNPAALAYYNISGTLSQKVQGTVSSLTNIFFPIASALHAAAEKEKIQRLYRRVIRVVLMLATGLSLALVVAGRPLLQHWVGKDFAVMSLTPLYILTATYFMLALYTTVAYFAIGLGDVKRIAFATTSMFALNVIFLVLFLPSYAIIGAAWAYLLSTLPVPFIMHHIERRYLNLSGSFGWYSRVIGGLLVSALLAWGISRLALVPYMSNLITTLIGGGIAFVLFFALYRLCGFMAAEEWELCSKSIKRLLVLTTYPLAALLFDRGFVRRWLYVHSEGYLPMRWLFVSLLERRILALRSVGEDVWGPRCGVLYDLKHHLYDNAKKQEVYETHYGRTIAQLQKVLAQKHSYTSIIDYGSGPGVLTAHLRKAAPVALHVYGFGLDQETLSYNQALHPDVRWQMMSEFSAWFKHQKPKSVCLVLDGVLAFLPPAITEELLSAPQVGAVITYYTNPLFLDSPSLPSVYFDVEAVAKRCGWKVETTIHQPLRAGGPTATSAIYTR